MKWEWIEGAFMLICVAALWPVVASMRSGAPLPRGYSAALAVAAAGLLVVTARRVIRIQKAFQEQQRNKKR